MTQPNEKLRVVVDTNLFVRGTILKRGNPHALLTAWRASACILHLSDNQYRELAGVFSRPKLVDRYRLTVDELANLFEHLAGTPRVTPASTLPLDVRDAKDEHILASVLGGDADYFITGDEDLLVLRDDLRLGTLQIVTVAEFLAILQEEGGTS